MNSGIKDNYLESRLKFLLQNYKGSENNNRLVDLSKKMQSAIILNMEVFRRERMKDLDLSYKSVREELIENSALRILKNESANKNFHMNKLDNVELWRTQNQIVNFEKELEDSGYNQKSTKKGRKGMISNMKKLIVFDKEKYEEQMKALKDNPEKFDYLRTSHSASAEDKNILISQYLKHQRRKPLFEGIDTDSQVYHISRDNLKYNEKLDRAYGKYTEEIKKNLERGTAI